MYTCLLPYTYTPTKLRKDTNVHLSMSHPFLGPLGREMPVFAAFTALGLGFPLSLPFRLLSQTN